MKTKIQKFLPIMILLGFIIFYFQYSVTIAWDSAHYMTYVNIFEGNASWNTWDVVRGPVFPFIIYVSNILFGRTSQGLIMNTMMYYILMIIFFYKLLNYCFTHLKITRKKQKLLYIIILISVIINPIIYGFYHTLLTEFVAITLAIISCYLSMLWLETDYNHDHKKYIILTLIISGLTVFGWFLKQPYVSCGLFAPVVAYIISLFEKRKISNFITRTISIGWCLLVLLISINAWNVFLSKTGNNPDTNRNPTNSLGNQLISAINEFKISHEEEIFSESFIEKSKLSKKEKREVVSLLEKEQDYVIINIYKDGQIVEADYLKSNSGNVSTVQSVIYILRGVFQYTTKIINSYFVNYLSIVDVYSTSSDDGVGYVSNQKIDLLFSNEISTISLRPYNYGLSNIFYMTPEMLERVSCYEQTNFTFKGLNVLMRVLGKIYLLLFKLIFVILPFALIASIVIRIFRKKEEKYNNVLDLIIILFGFSFLHILLHTVTGAIIDRYAIPVFLTTYLGIILLIIVFLDRKGQVSKKKTRKKES